MSRFSPWFRLIVVLVLALLLVGCNNQPDKGANTTQNTPVGEKHLVLHIGHQRADPLNLLKLRGDLEKRLASQGVTVEWVNFTAGLPLLEALGVGSIDFGSTGDSPALFAQAAGTPLVYVANIPLGDNAEDGEAIIVPKDSPIHTVADLKGKKVAFQKASGSHNLLLQHLQIAGLAYSDIKPIYLSPPDGRVAFESGSIDAWVIWDPFLATTIKKSGAHIIANRKGIKTPGAFYLSSRKFATEHPELIKVVLEEINKTSAWSFNHPTETADLLAKSTGVDRETLTFLLQRRSRIGMRPIDESLLSTQQSAADNFFRIGLLPKKINIREAALTPSQYAQLIPAERKAVPNE